MIAVIKTLNCSRKISQAQASIDMLLNVTSKKQEMFAAHIC